MQAPRGVFQGTTVQVYYLLILYQLINTSVAQFFTSMNKTDEVSCTYILSVDTFSFLLDKQSQVEL